MAGERVLDGLKRYRRWYRKADKSGRSGLLDEFCRQTGYHRKYAITLLRKPVGTFLKRDIPIKTDHWDVTGPGACEIDLVSRSGPQRGEYTPIRTQPPLHR